MSKKQPPSPASEAGTVKTNGDAATAKPPAAKKSGRNSDYTPQFWARTRELWECTEKVSPAKAAARACTELGIASPPHHSSVAERKTREGWARHVQPAAGLGDRKPAREVKHPHNQAPGLAQPWVESAVVPPLGVDAAPQTKGNARNFRFGKKDAHENRAVTTKVQGKSGKVQANAGKPEISCAGDEQELPPDLDMTKLPMRWQIFIEEYLIDMNATQAAIRSGYTPSDADNRGCLLTGHPRIAPILQARLDERLAAIRMTRERVLDAFADMAEADGNELSELRRVCCRHCYGTLDDETQARTYQFTPAEFVRKKEAWEVRRSDLLTRKNPDIGDFPNEAGNWYDKRKPIDADCPECFGDGTPEVILKDTRNISRRARSIYGGVKEGKDGVEIKTYSREAALGVLAKHHKLYDEAPSVTVTLVSSDELDDIYAKGVADSDEKKHAVVGRGDRVRAASKGNG